ncbi:MAG: ferrochelatase, partial [Gammaproteobacteria bacterium]|nr:ferrochelatase [Gammaproteobacteria bacterium]
ADCLETLYEIDVEARKIFLEAGGRDFQYIPALNAEDGQVELMLGILRSLTAN